MSRTLYLLRHGQTRYNAELRLQGVATSELDPQGRSPGPRHGARLAKLLTEPTDWTIYASPSAGHGRRRSGCQQLGLDQERIIWDERLVELGMGSGRVAGCPSCWRPTPSWIWRSRTGICGPPWREF